MRWDEKLAVACIATALGVEVDVHDDGSVPSMFDLNIWYPNRAPGAVEVTAAADQRSLLLRDSPMKESAGSSPESPAGGPYRWRRARR
jgi:hypothetical protein